MGALYKNVCYTDLVDARVQACQSLVSSSLVGGDLHTSECATTDFDAPAMSICMRTNGGSCAMVSQPWPSTPDCAHAGGVSLAYDWFLVALPMLAVVWGGKQLIRLFDNPTIES